MLICTLHVSVAEQAGLCLTVFLTMWLFYTLYGKLQSNSVNRYLPSQYMTEKYCQARALSQNAKIVLHIKGRLLTLAVVLSVVFV